MQHPFETTKKRKVFIYLKKLLLHIFTFCYIANHMFLLTSDGKYVALSAPQLTHIPILADVEGQTYTSICPDCADWTDEEDDDDEWASEEIPHPRTLSECDKMQLKFRAFVEHAIFNNFILGAILINTLSMGIEYHNQVCVSALCLFCQISEYLRLIIILIWFSINYYV